MTSQTRIPSRLRAGLAAALALGLAAGGGPAAAQAFAGPLDLERAGWTLVTASDDMFVFMRPAETATTGVRRVWTAYDSDRPRDRMGFSFHSVQSLGEFDCRRSLSRVVAETFHAEPGLKGKTWQAPDFEPTEWAAPEPDSVGAMRMAFACKALTNT